MDEISIWALKGDEAEAVEAVDAMSGLDLENRLEETLVRRPEMLEPGIQLVGRQTPTDGGPSDLLGVDAAGQLVVFELKRGRVTRDAVTQCIDYASALDAMDPEEELAKHITEHSGAHGIEKIDNFKAWYREQYEEQYAENELSGLLPPRLVLVGLGVDDRAERMARFLQVGGIDFSVLTFYGFQHNGETLLARQVEVEHAPAIETRRRKPTTPEKRNALQNWLTEHGMKELFDTILNTLNSSLPNAYPLYPSHHTVSLNMSIISDSGNYSNSAFCKIRVGGPNENTISVILPRAALPRYDNESLQVLRSEVELTPHRGGFALRIDNHDHWEQQRDAIIRFAKAAGKIWRQQFESARRASSPPPTDAP